MGVRLVFLVACGWVIGGCHALASYSASSADATPSDLSNEFDVAVDGGGTDMRSPMVAGLEVLEIFSGVDRVYRGEKAIRAYVTVRNTLTSPVFLGALRISLVAGQGNFEMQFSGNSGTQGISVLPPGAVADLRVSIDLAGETPLGMATLGAQVDGALVEGGTLVRAHSAEAQALVWEVVDHWELIVTTTVDELDLDRDTPSLADAQEGTGVSLREAILLANSGRSADAPVPVITFGSTLQASEQSPAVFEFGSEGLPALERDGTQIDGTGRWIVLSGVGQPENTEAHGLLVLADDVTLRGIAMKDYAGAELRYGIQAEDVRRLRIVDSEFTRCGTAQYHGAQVNLYGGEDHVVFDSRFVDGVRDGLRIEAATRVLVQRNLMIGNGDDGVQMLYGGGHVVRNNTIREQRVETPWPPHSGVELYAVQQTRIEGNQIVDNPYGVGCSNTTEASSEIQVVGNVLSNLIADVVVGGPSRALTIKRNQFNGALDDPIDVESDANDGVRPPRLLRVEGNQLSGEAGSAGGSVEAYVREPASTIPSDQPRPYRFVAATPVQAGLWSIATNLPIDSLYLTYTNDQGSTSRLGKAALPN